MFEKEAEEYSVGKAHEHYNYVFEEHAGSPADFARWCFQDGAEFGYNKANEWHYVKDGDLPKEKGNYLVAWERTHHVEEFGKWGFDVDLFNADEGYFEGVGDYVIAWKEIVLPKESE